MRNHLIFSFTLFREVTISPPLGPLRSCIYRGVSSPTPWHSFRHVRTDTVFVVCRQPTYQATGLVVREKSLILIYISQRSSDNEAGRSCSLAAQNFGNKENSLVADYIGFTNMRHWYQERAMTNTCEMQATK
jgi:hypothetical protein